jgi:hypothetical protein
MVRSNLVAAKVVLSSLFARLFHWGDILPAQSEAIAMAKSKLIVEGKGTKGRVKKPKATKSSGPVAGPGKGKGPTRVQTKK